MPIIRVNYNCYEEGEEYRNRLINEANFQFQIFLRLLSSYWQSTIDGPNYTREIKTMCIELARIRLALENIQTDSYYDQTRGEFIYQVLTTILFPKKEAPQPELSDIGFREFLNEIIKIYFQGSIPKSIKEAVELVTNGRVIVTENFVESRKPGSKFDISDQFGFKVDIMMNSPSDFNVFLADKNIRILLNIIRPSHTLYRISYILEDEYIGQQDPDPTINKPHKIIDTFNWILKNYGYEDFRRFFGGIKNIDLLGMKQSIIVMNENHNNSF